VTETRYDVFSAKTFATNTMSNRNSTEESALASLWRKTPQRRRTVDDEDDTTPLLNEEPSSSTSKLKGKETDIHIQIEDVKSAAQSNIGKILNRGCPNLPRREAR
jgi:hypothetical protein